MRTGFLIEARCGHDDALETKRGIPRLADQVRAIEEQPHSGGVGLLREFAIGLDDRILATGDDLHWLVVGGLWLMTVSRDDTRTTNRQPLTIMLKSISS